MHLADRSRLISRGLATTAALHPASLLFTGFPAIPASRRASAQTAMLRAGGFTESAPTVYLVKKTDLPGGLALEPRTTTFVDAGATYRLEALDDEPHEPHVRLTANLASR